jgi:hypothetical protein
MRSPPDLRYARAHNRSACHAPTRSLSGRAHVRAQVAARLASQRARTACGVVSDSATGCRTPIRVGADTSQKLSCLGLGDAAYLPRPTAFVMVRAAMQAGDPEPCARATRPGRPPTAGEPRRPCRSGSGTSWSSPAVTGTASIRMSGRSASSCRPDDGEALGLASESGPVQRAGYRVGRHDVPPCRRRVPARRRSLMSRLSDRVACGQ